MIKRFRFTRSLIFTLRILIRYTIILLIGKMLPYSWRQGLLSWTNRRVAARIRRYIFRLRGLYIKVGQFLGMMTNLFVRDFVVALADLQDRVPPVPYNTIKKRFIAEWGKTPDEIFYEFDEKPIAAASLGQVHIARLEDGTKLAVKALYPDAENLVKYDLNTVRAIANLISYFFPYFDMAVVYSEFADMIIKEIDYHKEKENIAKFKENFKNEHDFIFPEVYEKYSCSSILTTRYIDGIKINDITALEKAGLNPAKVSANLVRAFCKMIFTDQFFHADPHPGNFFVLPDHKIAFVDFGAVETISLKNKNTIRNLARAIITRDIEKIVESIEQIGVISKKADIEDIENMITIRYDKLANLRIQSYKDLNFKDFNNIKDLKTLDLRLTEILHYFQIPHNYLLLGRTITLLSGLAVDLNPKVNIFQIAWPFIKGFIFGADRSLSEIVHENAYTFAKNSLALPEYALKTMNTINTGKIKVSIKDFSKDVRKVYRLGHQFIYAFFTIAFLAFGTVFYLNNKLDFAKYAVYTAGAFGFFLLISFWRNRKL